MIAQNFSNICVSKKIMDSICNGIFPGGTDFIIIPDAFVAVILGVVFIKSKK